MNAPLQGFVDLQVNGFRGVDFSAPDLEEESAAVALRGLVADGTAILLPTLITSPEDIYARNLPILTALCRRQEFASNILGFHLEGPFLCPREGVIGAHNPAWTRHGDLRLLERLQDWAGGLVRLLTVAPDIPGAAELIAGARCLGMTVALGHHLGTAEEMDAAVRAGATGLTHLGNGLPHRIDRHRNPLIDGLADSRLTACVIGDGHHLPWNLLSVILRAKGIERCALVSDASSLAGMEPGTYPCFGATACLTPEGRLYNPDTGYLMGSALTIRGVVNATRQALGLSDADIYRLAVENPLRLIGCEGKVGAVDLPRGARGDWEPFRG